MFMFPKLAFSIVCKPCPLVPLTRKDLSTMASGSSNTNNLEDQYARLSITEEEESAVTVRKGAL